MLFGIRLGQGQAGRYSIWNTFKQGITLEGVKGCVKKIFICVKLDAGQDKETFFSY